MEAMVLDGVARGRAALGRVRRARWQARQIIAGDGGGRSAGCVVMLAGELRGILNGVVVLCRSWSWLAEEAGAVSAIGKSRLVIDVK
jgi:hypothetical protein